MSNPLVFKCTVCGKCYEGGSAKESLRSHHYRKHRRTAEVDDSSEVSLPSSQIASCSTAKYDLLSDATVSSSSWRLAVEDISDGEEPYLTNPMVGGVPLGREDMPDPLGSLPPVYQDGSGLTPAVLEEVVRRASMVTSEARSVEFVATMKDRFPQCSDWVFVAVLRGMRGNRPDGGERSFSPDVFIVEDEEAAQDGDVQQ